MLTKIQLPMVGSCSCVSLMAALMAACGFHWVIPVQGMDSGNLQEAEAFAAAYQHLDN